MESLQLRSQSFVNNGSIPQIFTCDGADLSPQLSWQNPPPATQSFVLIMEDPDAPRGTWIHWVLFNIPAHVLEMPEAVQYLPEGVQVGKNSWGHASYGGPCPPGQEHRYFFDLYAMDCLLSLDHGVDYETLKKAMEGHVLDHAQLMGKYKR
jgi:Raf kinase inhibitor-like YbhB/YbcL family protein